MTWSLPSTLRLPRRRPPLRPVEMLEDRACPVIGAYDIPGPIGVGEGYDGVARINNATGALLSTGRHLLTAAHVANPGSTADSRFVVSSLSGPVDIATPGLGFVPHPNYPPAMNQPDDYDIGVMVMAELAPLTAERWDLYTDTDEVGRVGQLVGYGGTGTGTIGHSTDIVKAGTPLWPTDTFNDLNYEVVRFTITGNPTGGFFFPQLLGQDPPVLAFVPHDTDAATLAAGLNALPGLSQVRVRLVGDSDNDGTVDNWGNPHAGSFEALCLGTAAGDHSLPDLFAVDTFTGGTNPGVVVEKLLEGGSDRIKTGGRNLVAFAEEDVGARLFTDFDDGTAAADTFGDGQGQGVNEGHGTWGDSGCPLFIDGRIAGVLEGLLNSAGGFGSGGGYDGSGGTGDFGEIDSWARVSFHLDFLNDLLDDPFDLVLDMENQPWGNDAVDETTIEASRFGGEFRIRIDGVLRYTCPMDQLLSVTIRGSDDDETIVVSGLGEAVPVTITGRGGDDTIRLNGLATGGTATLDGDDGDDTIVLADDFDSDFRDDITVDGGDGADTLLIDDTADANGEPGPLPLPIDFYCLTADTFSKPSVFGAVVTFGGVESVRLDANPQNNVISVTGVASGVDLEVFANGGDDSVVAGGGDYDGNIDGDLLAHGGFGTDTLVIDDADDLGGGTHTLGADTYTKSSAAGAALSFQFMQAVRLDTSAAGNVVHIDDTFADVTSLVVNTAGGDDTVYVHAVNAATAVAIDTGGGDDAVEVGDGDLDTIDGYVTVHGGAGTDALNVHDQADAGEDEYWVTSGGVARHGFTLAYDGVQVLTLDAGTGNNVINVDGTAAGTAVAVNAGGGGDTVRLAAAYQDLGALAGPVTVTGQGGADAVILYDLSLAAGAVYNITGTTVDRGLFGGLTYGTVEDLQLRLGSGDNTVNVTGLAPGTLTHLFGNAGDDTFNFFAPAPEAATGGHLVIGGGGPTDVADGDTINVYWQQPKPDIKKQKTVGDLDAGYVDLDYGDGLLYEIDYDDIELVNVEKL